MKKFVLISLITIAIAFPALGWQYYTNLGGSVDDGRGISMCADGGFFVSGRSNAWALGGFSSNPYDYQFFLIKLDSLGNEEWIRNYGQNGTGYYDASWMVCGTPDSGALLCGKTQSPTWVVPRLGNYYDNVLLIRVDKDGDTLWTKAHDGGSRLFDRAWWVSTIPGSNDFFFTGPATVHSDEQSDIWFARIDSVGNMIADTIWQATLRDGPCDVRWATLSTDGGFVAVGCSGLRDTSYYYPDYDSIVTHRISRAHVFKVDSLCNIEWVKTYDTSVSDHYPRSITTCLEGGYLMTMYDKWPAWTMALRLDENGDTLWTRYVGLDPADSTIRLANFTCVTTAPDGGFYFSGSGQGWGWIVKTDSDLEEEWVAPFDLGSYTENFLVNVVTPDGGCCAAGQTYSVYPSVYSDIFVARVSRFGDDWYGVEEEKPTALPTTPKINIFPNPFNGSVTVDIGTYTEDYRITVFDLSGRQVEQIPAGENIWRPECKIPSGTYLFRIDIDGQTISKKAVYLK